MDEDSFDNLHLRWPWPRSVRVRLLDAIEKGNPRAVAFDILFPEPTTDRPREDRLLAAAMGWLPNVFLAMVIKPTETVSGGVRVMNVRLDRPIPPLRQRAVAEGFTNVIPGNDGFLREADVIRIHQGQAVPRLAKALYDRLAKDLHAAPISTDTRQILINFRRPRGTFPTIPYFQVVTRELHSEWTASRVQDHRR